MHVGTIADATNQSTMHTLQTAFDRYMAAQAAYDAARIAPYAGGECTRTHDTKAARDDAAVLFAMAFAADFAKANATQPKG